jgi:hypothetical protein
MPKRKRDDDDAPVSFAEAAAAPQPAQDAPAATPRGRTPGGRRVGLRGPLPDDDSLAARLERGEASHLHGIIDVELHRRLKVLAVTEGRTLSEVVEAAVREYLERHA